MLNKAGRQEGSPLLGAECAYLRVGDICPQDSVPVAMLTAVSVDTTSSTAFSGCHGTEVGVTFSNAATDCDLDIIITDGTDKVVKTVQNVQGPTSFYVTPAEGIDLKGCPVKVRAYNFAGGGNVTVNLTRTS